MSHMTAATRRPRHRRGVAPEVPVGSDGLTRAEQAEFMAEFRRTMGKKPADTQELRDHFDRIADKLVGHSA